MKWRDLPISALDTIDANMRAAQREDDAATRLQGCPPCQERARQEYPRETWCWHYGKDVRVVPPDTRPGTGWRIRT